MSPYIALTEFKNAWMFRREDLPVSDNDAEAIRPMTEPRAAQLWKQAVSTQVDHPDFFKKGDWAFAVETWGESGDWESVWDSDQTQLPEELIAHLDWDDNTLVYYCVDQRTVLETRWGVFKRTWKCFLFMDDGALLVGKKRNQVVQFLSNGSYRLGDKS
ncbi:DUF2947 domain-containing protein [Paraferrimonas sedimenticola]|uniref:DUF2947 domain-containing protein n=1 Tax=Paraferrimonas sedimenticola TaxID=375674 RepID=A0AA37W0N9_9GAMM|nr:DUF2947 domain-containing protein [Paraferrimonas sedimenticola]GLP95683.1 hypothetical protein GCM10007895_09890 [Paraferrimonas sedimenticola]